MEDAPTTVVAPASDDIGRETRSAADTAAAIEYADGVIETEAEGENKFQKAISAWRNINLTALIPTLDTTASDLVAHQRDSLVERKDLAQKTKDFRKLEDAAKLIEVKALLKAYQTYIDLVTNQTKTVSSAFLQVYSSLSEAPDPYPLLEASIESLVVADETVPRLEAENQLLQASNARLTAQLEEAERRLEEERSTRLAVEDASESRIREIQASWAAVLEEKQGNWDAKERNLEERAENQERLLKEVKASYEVAQRLERGEEIDGGAAPGVASTAELDFVTLDLERANLRLAEVENRNEQLRLELARSATQQGVSKAATAVEDEPAFMRLRSENSSLLRKVDATRIERETDKREWDTTSRSLKKEIASLKQDSATLRTKIAQWHDYPDVKRELEILKSVEFATGEEDFTGAEEQGGSSSSLQSSNQPSGNSVQNLEQLLLARNKKLNNELTILRVSHQNLASRVETLQENLSNANIELEKSRNLTATLENDLTRVQDETTSHRPAMSVAGTHVSRYPSMSYGSRRGRISPTSSIISGMDPSMSSPSMNMESIRAGEPIGGGSGILPMITAQRDRFKKRITELEAELAKSYQNVSALRSEVASLQKDNLNLYEKTRFVSTYSRTQPTASANPYAANSNPSTIQMPDGADAPMDRYKSAYESKISPFAAFRGRESARALKRMSLPERAMLQVTKVVLANRTSRNVFAVYFFGLHLLIFMMMYFSGGAEIGQIAGESVVVTRAVGDAAGAIMGGQQNVQDSFQGIG